MIRDYVSDIATQMGINLHHVSLEGCQPLQCLDVQLLKLSSKGHKVNALVFNADIENMQKGIFCDSLEVRLRGALSRLHMMIQP